MVLGGKPKPWHDDSWVSLQGILEDEDSQTHLVRQLIDFNNPPSVPNPPPNQTNQLPYRPLSLQHPRSSPPITRSSHKLVPCISVNRQQHGRSSDKRCYRDYHMNRIKDTKGNSKVQRGRNVIKGGEVGVRLESVER